MYINGKTDNSVIRKKAEENKQPIIEFILKKLESLSQKDSKNYTLFAVCPNSLNVLAAAIRAAKRANAPILFAATLNQVDIDGGYTNWSQNDLIRIIQEQSYKIGYKGPTIACVDHGGPWVKDIQRIERWDLKKSMNWIKKSFEASILAGFDLIHVDSTVDLFNQNITIETVVERTIELIDHSESFRKKQGGPPISYEVGTEEVRGGLANLNTFNKFLKLLKQGLKEKGLEDIWPIFIVAKVGTDLHTSEFDYQIAKKVSSIAREYGSYIKGHYTDFVSNPQDYPLAGVGAANVGPEFTVVEYEALQELENIEMDLYKKGRVAIASNLSKKIKKAVLDSERWKKWLLPGEKDFDSLAPSRKDWILKTSSRYIWAEPEVSCAQHQLHKNLEANGIDSTEWVLSAIEAVMDKYFREFNLIDINKKIVELL